MIQFYSVTLILLLPRYALGMWYLFGSLTQGFQGWLWPLVGFFLMPCTTLVYAGSHIYGEGIEGGWFALMILAVLLDVAGGLASMFLVVIFDVFNPRKTFIVDADHNGAIV